MNSKNQNHCTEQPLFRLDPETGKRILLPMKLSLPKSNSKCKSSERKGKRMLLIKPLHLTAADFEEPSHKSKIRKTDNNSVRKELFNVPSKATTKSRSSLNTRRTLSRRSGPSNKMQQKINKPCELSPLLDMEEVEEELINKKGCLQGYPFKTPSKPAIKFTSSCKNTPLRSRQDKKTTPVLKVTDKEKTPGSSSNSSNETEFLELEQICCAEHPDKMEECDKSPISSVCSLLKDTVINSTKKEKNNKNGFVHQNVVRDIENMLCQCKSAFEEYKTSRERTLYKIAELLEADRKQYDDLVMVQEKNTTSITDILDRLRCGSSSATSQEETSKEKTPVNRRSIRLLNKSPVQTNGAKLIVSPGVFKSRDLRRSTLTKNLVTKTQQYNINSPRIKKALNMYNSLRCEVSVLETPRLDRSYLNESPRSTNLSKNLSRRLQNQCLLLQDTPIHK